MNKNSPKIDTITGWIFLASESGSTIDTVKMVPKLVPSQRVGNIADGSNLNIWLKFFIEIPTFSLINFHPILNCTGWGYI